MLNYTQNPREVQSLYQRGTSTSELDRQSGGSAIAEGPADGLVSLSEVLNKFTDPGEAWSCREARKQVSESWISWVSGLANWKTFVTLTFKDEKAPDVAMSLFKWWVRINNEQLFGKRYLKKVGHSYFSYVVGMEYQSRDVIHFHVLVDKPINFKVTHKAWGNRCGFAWIDGDFKNKENVISYVCKYVMKGGEIEVFKAKKDFKPEVLPVWWVDNQIPMSRAGALQPGVASPLTWSLCANKQYEIEFSK